MRKAGLSELSNTNILVVLLIIGLIFLSQILNQQIQRVIELLSQAEVTKPLDFCPDSIKNLVKWGERENAYDN